MTIPYATMKSTIASSRRFVQFQCTEQLGEAIHALIEREKAPFPLFATSSLTLQQARLHMGYRVRTRLSWNRNWAPCSPSAAQATERRVQRDRDRIRDRSMMEDGKGSFRYFPLMASRMKRTDFFSTSISLYFLLI